jgi:hypothetical protein
MSEAISGLQRFIPDIASLIRAKACARRAKQQNPVQIFTQKFFAFLSTQIICVLASSHPSRGAYRDRHGRWVGCGGRERIADERSCCGRRSRVVLTPRCWRYVCELSSQAMVANKPGHQGEREVSRKTTAQEMPGVPVSL